MVAWLAIFDAFFLYVASGRFDYHNALTKSLLEAQRSAEFPSNNSIPRRGDSALQDGTLSGASKFYAAELEAAGEMENVRCAILWGTDYFLKAADREKLFI